MLFGVLTTRLLLIGVEAKPTSISGFGKTRISSSSSRSSLIGEGRLRSSLGVDGRTIQCSSAPLQIGQSSWSLRFEKNINQLSLLFILFNPDSQVNARKTAEINTHAL